MFTLITRRFYIDTKDNKNKKNKMRTTEPRASTRIYWFLLNKKIVIKTGLFLYNLTLLGKKRRDSF